MRSSFLLPVLAMHCMDLVPFIGVQGAVFSCQQGFREQVRAWPRQPLDAAVAWLAGQPAGLRVVDLGCGDAQLAARVWQTVASIDLVAAVPGVIACNMAHTPLSASFTLIGPPGMQPL